MAGLSGAELGVFEQLMSRVRQSSSLAWLLGVHMAFVEACTNLQALNSAKAAAHLGPRLITLSCICSLTYAVAIPPCHPPASLCFQVRRSGLGGAALPSALQRRAAQR